MKLKKETDNRGITLIALVITIIVLLILVGVTIATLTGENGILTRAETSKKETEAKQMQEQIRLAVVSAKMNDKHNLSMDTEVLEDELYNNLGTEITINKKGTNEGLPWEITKGNYTFKIEEEGKVTPVGESEEGSEEETEEPELKVGDYITGYTLRDTINAEVATEIANLNSEVNSLSGDETIQTLSQVSNAQWRILEINEATGQPTKLISANGIGTLRLRGAMGYNNAVYLINKACEVLYSGEQGTARSITIEDLEEHYSATGKAIKENYKAGETKLGDPKRFTSSSYIYYPQIAKEEKGMGIDTEIYTAEDRNIYNTLNNSGIERSNKGNAPYAGTETKGSAYDQASTNGITVTQSYYSFSAASSLSACYKNEVYYSLFHGVSSYYWLASRCVHADSSSGYCNFRVRCVNAEKVSGYNLFASHNYPDSYINNLRPIINLTSNIQAEYVGASSSTGYNTWNIQ